jgi:flagellar M-ring protein FliF
MASAVENLMEQIGAMSRGRQLMLAVSALGSIAFFSWVITDAGAPDYRALYRGLEEQEVARVADGLQREGIPYELSDGGTTIQVPGAMIYEARMRMAGQGLPNGGNTGFEIFDKPAFGVTEFVHQVNYARAVQGELSRTIEQLDPVDKARVQVVIPKRRNLVADNDRDPRASVVVKLRPGAELARDKVRAIVFLVASTIESISIDHITVVDATGRLLAPLSDNPSGKLAAGGAPDYQQRVEGELAARIEALLGKTVGLGQVVARVRAEMDWTESETTEEAYDPDSQVARSEQRSTEEESDGAVAEGGPAGVAANTPGGPAGGGAPTPSSRRTSETVNFEISKKVSRSVTPMGRIKKLAVAVLVADQAADGAEEAPIPWSEENLQRFEQLAKQVVGFSEERGDQITVTSAPFQRPEFIEEEEPLLSPELLILLSSAARILALLIGVVAFGKFVIGPLVGGLSSDGAAIARVADLEAKLAAVPLAASDGASGVGGAGGVEAIPAAPPEPLSLSEEVGVAAATGAANGVTTIRNWLNQE